MQPRNIELYIPLMLSLSLLLSACGGGGGSGGGEQPSNGGGSVSANVSIQGNSAAGRIVSVPGGIDCPSQCNSSFGIGSAVSFTATANTGYRFVRWHGACEAGGACNLSLNQNVNLTAEFQPVQEARHALSVSRVGSGTVTSAPTGIRCGDICSYEFDSGTQILLTPAPANGFTFSGWEGACTGNVECIITMNQDVVVNAVFQPLTGIAECTVTRSTGTTPVVAPQHPRILLNNQAVKECLQGLMAGNAAPAERFKQMVDEQLAGGNVYGFEAWYAALMFQLTGEQRYADYAIQRIDSFVTGEERLIAQGQRARVAGDSYLEVGTYVGDVMLVYDWCYNHLTAQQRSRWLAYANQAVWNVWNHTQASWGGVSYPWTGWSVNNPVNNYYYSFLRATMALGLASFGEHSEANNWINKFRTSKLENQLFPAFNRDLAGGGSREGTGYGTAMRSLFQLYDWWERSTGERIAEKTEHTRSSMLHLMHSTVPTLDRLAPTGDHARDSSAALFDYHREYLLSLIALFPEDALSGVAKTLLTASSVPRMENRFMFIADFLYNPPRGLPLSLSKLNTTYWAPGTGQLMMRNSWERNSTWANFICGPYTESHAHRDQGSFVIYKGKWLAFDANINSHSGIEQAEELHNLVRIERNGVTLRQVVESLPCRLDALTSNNNFVYALADVTPIYNQNQSVVKVEREFLFLKPDAFIVFDRVVTNGAGINRVWTLNTPRAATISGDSVSYIDGDSSIEVKRISPSNAQARIVGSRYEAVHSDGNESRFLHVIGLNGSVSNSVLDSVAGMSGVRVVFSSGGEVTVRFNESGRGGTMSLKDADANIVFDGVLPVDVVPPETYSN